MLSVSDVSSILKHFGMTEPHMQFAFTPQFASVTTAMLSAMRDRCKYSLLAADQRTK